MSQNKDGKGIPITRIETISEERIDQKRVGFVKNISDAKINEYRLLNSDILFSHINSLKHIGKTAIYEGEPPLILHGMNLLLLRPKNEVINSYYFLYLLKYFRIKAIFKNMSKKAVNQASINQTELSRVKIPLPPLPEQHKIAEILSTIDSTIQKIDDAIAKTGRLKKGLMQELLTKGIGHERFKDTEIGRIPEEWEVMRLEDVSLEITDGSHYSPKEDKNGVYRIATVANIRKNQIDIDSCKKISKEDYEKLVKNGCKACLGDVLFSKDGTVGLSFSFKQNVNIVLLSSIAIIKPKDCLDSDFCTYVLKATPVFRQIIGSKRGTGLRRVILEDLKRIKIPIPRKIEEQQKIAEILSTVDKKLELERARKEKLGRVKKGLMNDLLTGRKRVE